jgi:hypothetical protein
LKGQFSAVHSQTELEDNKLEFEMPLRSMAKLFRARPVT